MNSLGCRGVVLQSPLAVSVIDEKLKQKMVSEFTHIRKQAVEPLASFLDFISCVLSDRIQAIRGCLH